MKVTVVVEIQLPCEAIEVFCFQDIRINNLKIKKKVAESFSSGLS